MIKHWITFDLDGTLMQNPFGKWVFPEINSIVQEKTNYKANISDQLIAEHHRRMHENLIVEAYDWDAIVKVTLERNHLDVNIDVEQLVIKHTNQPKVYLLEEDILESLQCLRDKGYHLAVVTNGYTKYQLPVLNKLKLTPLFDLILTPEKEGYAKPNIKMVDRLSGNNRIIAHVGDRIDHDVVFANELNVHSLFLYRGMSKSLKELDPIKRGQTKESMSYCKDKLYKENGICTTALPSMYIPKIMIDSIHEINGLLKTIDE